MADPYEFYPGYISPLTDQEHARLGRIAILWGQIEHFVEVLLPYTSGLQWEELEVVGLTSKPIGAKVDFLNLSRKRLKDPELSKAIGEFCSLIHETKTNRNHAFHGIWGWRGDVRSKSVFPAARKTSQPSQPLKSSQLPALERKLCQCSRMGSDLTNHFYGWNIRGKFNRYFHHGDKDDLPRWLDQWSERNSLDCELLDRICKAGQLPRLEKHYPRK